MPGYKILDGEGSVINKIIATSEFMEANYNISEYIIDTEYVEPAEYVPPRHITRLAFLNRFTDAEAVAIDLASIGATETAATLRRYQAKVNAATYIDLDREDTRAGVIALETAGLLGTGRALEILDNEILDHERPEK